tara:strand:- start:292 stop:558 length:267 start_codon:yes stop_codon:yes gene_type:complete
MEFDIYVPYGINYHSNEPFKKVTFINNEDYIVEMYYVKNKQKDKLAGLLFPLSKKKFIMPKSIRSFLIIFGNRYINLVIEDGWTYEIP